MSSPESHQNPFLDYARSVLRDKVKPFVNVFSFMRLRRSIIDCPTIALTDVPALGNDWRGPVGYALQGTAYVVAAVTAIISLVVFLNNPEGMKKAKGLFSLWKQIETFTAPLTLFFSSYLFRYLLKGQPHISEGWVAESAHVLHLTYV